MLEYLRNAADKPVAKVLMFILIFSFVGWGAAEWIFGGATRDTTLLSVGGADISVQQFNNEKSRQLSTMTKDEQRATYTDPARATALNNSVMSKITLDQLALNRAKDLGFVVSDKRIASEIKSYPEFTDNGEFVPWKFDYILQNSGMTEQDFANYLRADILRNMTLSATAAPVRVPDFAVDAAYNARYARREINYATVKFGEFRVGNPTEEDLKNFYAQNPQTVPETRTVSYVFVAADMNKPDVYDEKFKVAQQIEDMIISGDSMKTAADKHKAKYAQIANVERGKKVADKILGDDLIAKAFAMESGTESELLELKEGFVILRVDAVVPQHNAEFDDVKKSLVNAWKKSEQRKLAYVGANEKLIALNNGGDVKNMRVANVTRVDGAPLVILNATFAGKAGDNVLVEDGDAFYVVKIGNTTMPKSDKAKKDALRKELEKMSVRFVTDDYTEFLKQEYPVKVHEKTFNRFIAK